MNFEHLKLFIRVAETQNISMAGHSLGLSAAVASNQINKLEQSLGVRLIHRTTRKVSLTEEGKSFLPYAEEVINSVNSAQQSLKGEQRIKGRLRLSAPASFARMHLVPALCQFFRLHPELTIDLKLSDTIVNLVEGGFDVAIRISALKDSTLIARKLMPEQRILCASPAYIQQYGQPTHPQDLNKHQCLVLPGVDNWVFKTTTGNISIKANGPFSVDNGEVLRDACVQGLGITLCSTWIAHEQLKNKQLVQVLKDYPLLSDSDIWAVYPSAKQLAPKVKLFIDFLKAYFTENSQWSYEELL